MRRVHGLHSRCTAQSVGNAEELSCDARTNHTVTQLASTESEVAEEGVVEMVIPAHS